MQEANIPWLLYALVLMLFANY